LQEPLGFLIGSPYRGKASKGIFNARASR